MARPNEILAAQREQKVLDTLKAHGPMACARLYEQADVGDISYKGYERLINRLASKGKVEIVREGSKSIRLPGQGASKTASRWSSNRRGQMGAQVDQELVERAAQVYEEGHKVGTFGLSERLGITLAEAIACVGVLFAQGRIRVYGEVYIATVPHPKRAA